MTAEHDVAAQARAFGRVAGEYQRARPGYAAAAVTAICDALGLPQDGPVLDIGAGTGALSTLLVQRGAEVIAVEPLTGMRERIAPAPRLTVREGSAESLPVADGEAAAAVVATAFHWFATTAALREITRVTRPPHRLALVWNDRDQSVEWVRAYGEIVTPYAGSAPRYTSGEWREPFAELGVEIGPRQAFANPQPIAREAIVDRGLSTSFIAALPDAERGAVADRLRALAAQLPERLEFPYTTEVYLVEL